MQFCDVTKGTDASPRSVTKTPIQAFILPSVQKKVQNKERHEVDHTNILLIYCLDVLVGRAFCGCHRIAFPGCSSLFLE